MHIRYALQVEGTVMVPEAADGLPHEEYDNQIHWRTQTSFGSPV